MPEETPSTPVQAINSINVNGTDYPLEDTVARARADALALSIYEVGDLFFSMNLTSPAARFGGEWEQLDNVFIRAANNTETGGSDEITLTVAQMPRHNHNILVGTNGKDLAIARESTGNQVAYSGGQVLYSGEDAAHSIMPAYQNVYVWQRVA